MALAPRVDRLERIAGLFVKAGLKMRTDLRELDEKFKMLVDIQMEHMELFLRNEERFAENEKRFARNEERFAREEQRLLKQSENTDRKFAELAEQQKLSDRKLLELMEIVRTDKNGKRRRNN